MNKWNLKLKTKYFTLAPPKMKYLGTSNKICQRRQWHPTSSTLAWKIPWTEEPGRLQSMGSLRVGHD